MDMKKIRMYAAALCAVALCSCTESVENLIPEVNDDVLVARIEAANGRTELGGEEMKSTFWSKDDALAVFRKNYYNCEFVLTEGEGTATGTFKYSGNYSPKSEDLTGNTIDKYYAVYPYDVDMTILEGNMISGVTFPAEQTYAEGTFDADAAFMTAIADGPTSMNFKKAHALLKIYLTPMPGDTYTVKSIKLESAAKALSGAATLDMSTEGAPVLTLGTASDNNKSLTLNCGDGVAVKAPTTTPIPFYIVVAPGTFIAKDLSITITYANGKSETKTFEEAVTFERNQIVTINYPCGGEDITGGIEGFGTSDGDLTTQEN